MHEFCGTTIAKPHQTHIHNLIAIFRPCIVGVDDLIDPGRLTTLHKLTPMLNRYRHIRNGHGQVPTVKSCVIRCRPSVCKYWKLHLDFYGNMSYNIFVDIFRQGEISLRWFHRRFGALHIFLIQLAALMWRQVKIFWLAPHIASIFYMPDMFLHISESVKGEDAYDTYIET